MMHRIAMVAWSCVMLLPMVGCAAAEAAPVDEAAAAHAHALGYLERVDGRVNPAPAKTSAWIQPAMLMETIDVGSETRDTDGELLLTAAGPCANGACRRPSAGSPTRCADDSCSAGDCAAGTCGASGARGPVRKLVAARPMRRMAGAIRQAKPVRRLFGRLFCRGCR